MKKSKFICSLVAGLMLTATSIYADEVGPKPLGPAPAEMAQFDFLIGNWTAVSKRFLPDGTLAAQYDGIVTAEFVDDGRVVFDRFTWFGPNGEKIFYDATLRTFSPKTGRWEMVFMSSLSDRRSKSFHGSFVDGEGHFEADVSLSDDASVLAKIRFFEIKKDSFEWSMEVSSDGGDTWFIGEKIAVKRVN